MSDPYAATPAQVRAMWDLVEEVKTAYGFLSGFFKRGSHRKEALAAIVRIGDALNRLDAEREVDDG